MDRQKSKGKKSSYHISSYTKSKAKRLNVQVRPSTRKGKKIDVFKNGKKIASIGALGYNDFTTFSRKSKSQARERQKAYHSRHRKDSSKKGSPGYYAAQLLW
jgi:hypothetical protein